MLTYRRKSRYVVLKILVSEISESTRELQILRHLAQMVPENTSSKYVTQLLDEFRHQGPNGTHTCLVFEPMGPSVNTMVGELPQFNPRMWGMKVRYPPWMAKSILKQSLQALDFLHQNNVAHGDFQPGNILFALHDDIDSKPEDMLRQEESVEARFISPPVQRLDGKADPWAPLYLCIAQPLTPFTPYTGDFKIKLSDMGGGKRVFFLIRGDENGRTKILTLPPDVSNQHTSSPTHWQSQSLRMVFAPPS